MWVINIARPVPSLNDRIVNGRDRISRAMYRRLRDGWATDMRFAAVVARIPRITDDGLKRRVVLTRIMGPRQREYDYDDLVGGCKPIIDAMKPAKLGRVDTIRSGPRKGRQVFLKPVAGAGLVFDDSPKWIEVEYRQERGKAPGCRIELEDVP